MRANRTKKQESTRGVEEKRVPPKQLEFWQWFDEGDNLIVETQRIKKWKAN